MPLITEAAALTAIGLDGSGNVEAANIVTKGNFQYKNSYTGSKLLDKYLHIDGDSDTQYVSIPANSLFDYSSNSFSILIDLEFESGTAGVNDALISNHAIGAGGWLLVRQTNSNLRFQYYNTNTGAYEDNIMVNAITGLSRLHIIITFNAGVLVGYVNGKQVFSNTVAGATIGSASPNPLEIFSEQGVANTKGNLYNFSLYNIALSSVEVESLYKTNTSSTSPVIDLDMSNVLYTGTKIFIEDSIGDNKAELINPGESLLYGADTVRDVSTDLPIIREYLESTGNFHYSSTPGLTFNSDFGFTITLLIKNGDRTLGEMEALHLFNYPDVNSNGGISITNLTQFASVSGRIRSSTGATSQVLPTVAFANRTSSQATEKGSPNYDPNEWVMLTYSITKNAPFNYTISVYLNGDKLGEESTTLVPGFNFNSATGLFRFLQTNQDSLGTFQGNIAYTGVWLRGLLPYEVKEMARVSKLRGPNSVSKFRPPTDRLIGSYQFQSGNHYISGTDVKLRNLAPESNFPIGTATAASDLDLLLEGTVSTSAADQLDEIRSFCIPL